MTLALSFTGICRQLRRIAIKRALVVCSSQDHSVLWLSRVADWPVHGRENDAVRRGVLTVFDRRWDADRR